MPRVVVDYIEAEPVMHEHKATHLGTAPTAITDMGDGEERTVLDAGTYYLYKRIGSALYRVALSLVSLVVSYRITVGGDRRIAVGGDARKVT